MLWRQALPVSDIRDGHILLIESYQALIEEPVDAL
jgi:hypothetical protein